MPRTSSARPELSALEFSNLAALNRLKQSLHQKLSFVKSSHLSEAIAAGLGQGSHAALLVLLKLDGAEFAHLPASDTAFEQRAHELGYGPAWPFSGVEFTEQKVLAQVVQFVYDTAKPEVFSTSDLDQCHAYGVVMRRKADGAIFATHPVAGVLGPFTDLEEAAKEAAARWLG